MANVWLSLHLDLQRRIGEPIGTGMSAFRKKWNCRRNLSAASPRTQSFKSLWVGFLPGLETPAYRDARRGESLAGDRGLAGLTAGMAVGEKQMQVLRLR